MLLTGTHQINRFERLLAAGYFPKELPPPFNTQSFAASALHFASTWQEGKILNFWTKPEVFSVPRHGKARRTVSIVNPVNQLLVANLVAKHWVEIRNKLNASNISEFHPSIRLKGGRAVSGVDYDAVNRKQVRILTRYGNYVKTDIARFYPSIYTHAIPWAMYGKAWVKGNLKDPAFKESFANKLDAAVRSGQEGQTIGIPIGPDTSRLIAELVACDVEQVISAHLSDMDARAVRYVDDFVVGFSEQESADQILSKLATGLYEYELDLNAEKTSIRGANHPPLPDWRHYIRRFTLSESRVKQREDIDSFFDQAVRLDAGNPRDNVLLYAARRAASFNVLDANRHHLFRWLMYAARLSPSCLIFVVQHLSSEHNSGRSVPKFTIKDFITGLLPTKAEAAHTAEVAWLLFWARELGLSVDSILLHRVVALRSSVIALLCLDLKQRGLINGSLDEDHWHSFARIDGLKSEMWLVAYEATKKAWWSKSTKSTFITTHSHFGELWSKDVRFYDERRKAVPQVGADFFSMLNALKVRRSALEALAASNYE